MASREQNERRFGRWEELPNGGRRYLKHVPGHTRRFALYVKEVDANEMTVLFPQEIYNAEGNLIEIHEKYPVDKKHQRLS